MRLVMEAAGLAFWPSLSLAVFFAACLGMLAWIYRPGSKAFYRKMSGMALEFETENETRNVRPSPEN